MSQFDMTPERPDFSRSDLRGILDAVGDDKEALKEELTSRGLTEAEISKVFDNLDSY